jgi:hypothetical protein
MVSIVLSIVSRAAKSESLRADTTIDRDSDFPNRREIDHHSGTMRSTLDDFQKLSWSV